MRQSRGIAALCPSHRLERQQPGHRCALPQPPVWRMDQPAGASLRSAPATGLAIGQPAGASLRSAPATGWHRQAGASLRSAPATGVAVGRQPGHRCALPQPPVWRMAVRPAGASLRSAPATGVASAGTGASLPLPQPPVWRSSGAGASLRSAPATGVAICQAPTSRTMVS